jgi:beta-glucosidase
MLAHGLAMPILRANAPESKHGVVFNATPGYPSTDKDQGAADYAEAENYHWFMDPVLKGEYPQLVVERQAMNMPMILEGDLDIISAPVDYVGINYYSRDVMRYNENGDIEKVTQDAEHTYIGWEIYPQGLTDLLVRLNERYDDLPPLYITENGAAGDDQTVVNGEVNDEQRVRYFQTHLNAVDQAIKAGVRVDGYFAWSLMDNFEWSFGYCQRFGMVHVDYQTQQRTLKQSAIAYRNTLLARAEENK